MFDDFAGIHLLVLTPPEVVVACICVGHYETKCRGRVAELLGVLGFGRLSRYCCELKVGFLVIS